MLVALAAVLFLLSSCDRWRRKETPSSQGQGRIRPLRRPRVEPLTRRIARACHGADSRARERRSTHRWPLYGHVGNKDCGRIEPLFSWAQCLRAIPHFQAFGRSNYVNIVASCGPNGAAPGTQAKLTAVRGCRCRLTRLPRVSGALMAQAGQGQGAVAAEAGNTWWTCGSADTTRLRVGSPLGVKSRLTTRYRRHATQSDRCG